MRLRILYGLSECPEDYFRPDTSSSCIPCPPGLSSDGESSKCLTWFERIYGTDPEPDQYDTFEDFWSNTTLRTYSSADPDHVALRALVKKTIHELSAIRRSIERNKTDTSIAKPKVAYSDRTLQVLKAALPIIDNPYKNSYLTDSEKWDAKLGLVSALYEESKVMADPSISDVDAMARSLDSVALLRALLDPTKPLIFPNLDNNCYINSLVQSLLALPNFSKIITGDSDSARTLLKLHEYKNTGFTVRSLDEFRDTLGDYHHLGNTTGGSVSAVFYELLQSLPSLANATAITALDMNGDEVTVHTLETMYTMPTISALVASTPLVGYSTLEGHVALTQLLSVPEVLVIEPSSTGEISQPEFTIEIALGDETKIYSLRAVVQNTPNHLFANVFNEDTKSWFEINNSVATEIREQLVVNQLSSVFIYYQVDSKPRIPTPLGELTGEMRRDAAINQLRLYRLNNNLIKLGEDFMNERIANQTSALIRRFGIQNVPGLIQFAGYNAQQSQPVIDAIEMVLSIQGLDDILAGGNATNISTAMIDVIHERDAGHAVAYSGPFNNIESAEAHAFHAVVKKLPGLIRATSFGFGKKKLNILDCSRCRFSDGALTPTSVIPSTFPRVLLVAHLSKVPPEAITISNNKYKLRAIHGKDQNERITLTAIWNENSKQWFGVNPFRLFQVEFEAIQENIRSQIFAVYQAETDA